jgi:hypothetical protein
VDHEPEVRGDHPVLRVQIAALDALGELDLLGRGQQRVARSLLEEELQRLEVAGQLLLLGRGGRVVQALNVAPVRARLAAADATSKAVLLLRIAVRRYPFLSLSSLVGLGMGHQTPKGLLMVRPT